MYLKSPIPWVGGKGKLLPVIHALAPEGYASFLDAFGGSGTVVLNHPRKKGCIEIYNDFNADLTNLFVCIRDRVVVLLKELGRLPLHSRIEYDLLRMFLNGEDFTKKYLPSELAAIEEYFPPLQAEELKRLEIKRAEMYDVRRAAVYFRSVRESFSGTGRSFGAKPCNIQSFFPLILAASRRMQEMIIENKDFAELYALHGGPGTWAYFDPPYVDTEDMYVFGIVPAGFRQVEAPKVYCEVLPNFVNGVQFTNVADVGGVYAGQWVMAVDRWVTSVYKPTDPTPLPRTGY